MTSCMHLFLLPLQAVSHYVYLQCESHRVCVDLRMVYRRAVLYVRCFSFPSLLSVSPFSSCSVHDTTGPCLCVKGSSKLHVLARFVKATATPTEKTWSPLQDDEVKFKVVLTNDFFTSATLLTRAKIVRLL
jgi:hypothetical protein